MCFRALKQLSCITFSSAKQKKPTLSNNSIKQHKRKNLKRCFMPQKFLQSFTNYQPHLSNLLHSTLVPSAGVIMKLKQVETAFVACAWLKCLWSRCCGLWGGSLWGRRQYISKANLCSVLWQHHHYYFYYYYYDWSRQSAIVNPGLSL